MRSPTKFEDPRSDPFRRKRSGPIEARNSLKSPLSYSVIFQYGVKGTTQNDLIRQNYADVTFVLNFGAIWYTKGKKFD